MAEQTPKSPGLTPEASRAGRALLNWNLHDLARESGLAFTTLSAIERGRQPYSSTAAKIVEAFGRHGVELVRETDRTGAFLIYARRASGDG